MSPILDNIPSIISLEKAPGAIQFTLIGYRDHSTAKDSVIRTTALLVVEYRVAADCAVVLNAATDAMFTILPGSPVSISRFATSTDSTQGPMRFVSNTASINGSSILTARWASGIPALFTKMVTVPKRSYASLSAARMLSRSVISMAIAAAVPPEALIS